jgi:hypothetical protein
VVQAIQKVLILGLILLYEVSHEKIDVGFYYWNSVLKNLFGLQKDNVTGEGKRLPNEELYEVYSSPNIIPIIKSKRMRWTRHVARRRMVI